MLSNIINYPGTNNPVYVLLAIVIAILGFRLIDRAWGADNSKLKAKLSVVGLAGVMYGLCGIFGVVVTFMWAVYRSMTFKGGAAAPTTDDERQAAFKRHLLPLIAMPLLTATKYGINIPVILVTALIFMLYTGIAYSLALRYGDALIKAREQGRDIGKVNMKIELLRGMAFGICFVLWYVVAFRYLLGQPLAV